MDGTGAPGCRGRIRQRRATIVGFSLAQPAAALVRARAGPSERNPLSLAIGARNQKADFEVGSHLGDTITQYDAGDNAIKS